MVFLLLLLSSLRFAPGSFDWRDGFHTVMLLVVLMSRIFDLLGLLGLYLVSLMLRTQNINRGGRVWLNILG